MKTALLRLSPLFLLALLACNSDGRTQFPSEDPANSGLVYASGWDLLKFNDGENKLDSTAHFEVGRNDCGWPAYGALDLAAWNDLAVQINQAMAAAPSVAEKEPCFPWPEPGSKGIDNTVELIRDGQVVKKLFFTRYDQVCSGIADPALSKTLLESMRKLNAMMLAKECPNGWGSN